MGTIHAGLGYRTQSHGGTAEFRNRVPAFLWGFAIFWYAMVAAFTGIAWRDGPPQDAAPEVIYAALALFWIAGIAVASMALAAPCIRVVVRDGRVEVFSRFPFHEAREAFRPADIQPAEVVDSVDSEGDRYYSAVFRAAGARSFTLEEGHHRPGCEAAARRFNLAAGIGWRRRSVR